MKDSKSLVSHENSLEELYDTDEMCKGGHNTYDITQHDYMLSGDEQWNYDQHAYVGNALYSPPHWKNEIKAMYETITMALIKENSHPLRAGNQLDVVKE